MVQGYIHMYMVSSVGVLLEVVVAASTDLARICEVSTPSHARVALSYHKVRGATGP